MDSHDLSFMTPVPAALQAGMRLRVGTVVECVGVGPVGHVYRVLDDLGSPIAVREYFPAALALRDGSTVRPQPQRDAGFEAGRKRFEEDGTQLAAFDHPGLLKIQQVWDEHGTTYHAMPWCEGRTLGEVLLTSPYPPSQAQLSDWLRAMADALAPIHRERGLHGHVSPSQVMLLDSGRLMLMEFARARRFLAPDLRDIERDPFAALECGSDGRHGPMGPWTDIYAMAAIAHLAVRRRPPQTPLRRLDYDAQEPLLQDIDGDYDDAFLHGIDCGLALRPRSRPRDLATFMARAGLHERRMRPRISGESLLTNLHRSEADRAAEVRTGPVVFDDDDIVLASVPASAFGPEVEEGGVGKETVEPAEASDETKARDTTGPALSEAHPETPIASPKDAPIDTPFEAPPPMAKRAARRARSTPIRTVPRAAPRRSRAESIVRRVLGWLVGIGALTAAVALGVMLLDEPDPVPLSWTVVPPTPARTEGAGTAQADAAPAPAEAASAPQASSTGASSPIPDPLEPTAAGPALASPATMLQVLPDVAPPAASSTAASASSPTNDDVLQVRDPEPARPITPQGRTSNPKPAKPVTATSPRDEPRRPAESADEASPPTSPCPDLLARQYIGRPLSAAEREQLNSLCR